MRQASQLRNLAREYICTINVNQQRKSSKCNIIQHQHFTHKHRRNVIVNHARATLGRFFMQTSDN